MAGRMRCPGVLWPGDDGDRGHSERPLTLGEQGSTSDGAAGEQKSLLCVELMLKPAAQRQDAVLGDSELPIPGGVHEYGDVSAGVLQKMPRPWFWVRREPGDLGGLLPARGARGLVGNRGGEGLTRRDEQLGEGTLVCVHVCSWWLRCVCGGKGGGTVRGFLSCGTGERPPQPVRPSFPGRPWSRGDRGARERCEQRACRTNHSPGRRGRRPGDRRVLVRNDTRVQCECG